MAHIFAPQGFLSRITSSRLISLPATWTIRRVNTFQLTRLAKLVLAHQRTPIGTDILGIKLIMRTIARVVCDEMGNGEVGECYMEIEMLQKI